MAFLLMLIYLGFIIPLITPKPLGWSFFKKNGVFLGLGFWGQTRLFKRPNLLGFRFSWVSSY